MKRALVYMVMICLCMVGSCHAYRRFTYVHHDFCLPVEDASSLLADMVETNAIPRKRSKIYTCQYPDSRLDVIYLSRLDRWRITRALRDYAFDLLLTGVLIDEIVAHLGGKRRFIVYHVLRDLTRQEHVTVGNIVTMLTVDPLL